MRVTEWPQHLLNCSVGRTERLGVAKWSPEVRFQGGPGGHLNCLEGWLGGLWSGDHCD